MQYPTCLNGAPFVQISGVVASDGAVIFPDQLPQVLDWNGDDTLNYVEVEAPATPGTDYAGGTYRQTLTYTDGNVTGVSDWVKQ